MKERIKNFKESLKNNLRDYKQLKTVYKQIPNILTSFRAIAPIPINILFFSGNVIGALTLSGVAFLTDAFDGMLARKFNIQSRFGADLDAICDKVLIAGIALPIVIQNPVMITNIILEALISITNVKAEFNGKTINSSMLGKLKTWVLSLTVLAGYLTTLLNLNISLATSILAIIPATTMQLVTFIQYAYDNNKSIKNNKTDEPKEISNNEDKQKENSISLAKSKELEQTNNSITREEQVKQLEELKNQLTETEPELKEDKTKTKRI